MNKKLEFILSTRFWAMVMASASVVLIDSNFPNQEWYVTLGKFLGLVSTGFVGVGTLDRISDKQLDVARINADISVKEAEKSIGK